MDSFLHRNGQDLAVQSSEWKGLCKDRSAEYRLRVLLVHFGCGHSLHEAEWRTRQAELADLSVVALWKWLKKLNG